MSCKDSNKGNFDDGVTYLGATYDGTWNTFKSHMNPPDRLSDVGKYSFSKFGNGLTLLQMGNHALHGEWSNVAQDVVVWKASSLVYAGIVGAFVPTIPVIIGATIAATATSIYLNRLIDELECDSHEKFKPNKDESPTQYYKKEYYDPIILDLDGNGVGTVAKFGYHGAMFDHDGDGIATQAGWVAVNDELWEMVV